MTNPTTQPKHTPGPWGLFNGCDIYTMDDGSDGRGHIAMCHPEGYENDSCDIPKKEAAANARLIAAAPELLEALRVCDAWFIENEDNDHHAEVARAAIAKATGEASFQDKLCDAAFQDFAERDTLRSKATGEGVNNA